jgi:Domain of unknown function (DUF4864)
VSTPACWPLKSTSAGHPRAAALLAGALAGLLLISSPSAQPWQPRAPLSGEELAPAEGISDADRRDIVARIAGQLQAFRRGDAVAAFAYASPLLQAEFATPAAFMAMVHAGYGVMFEARHPIFQDLVSYRGYPTQRVLLTDGKDRAVTALYLMRRDSGGGWRIAGCILLAPPGS